MAVCTSVDRNMLRTIMLMTALMFKDIFSGRIKCGIGCEEFFGIRRQGSNRIVVMLHFQT